MLMFLGYFLADRCLVKWFAKGGPGKAFDGKWTLLLCFMLLAGAFLSTVARSAIPHDWLQGSEMPPNILCYNDLAVPST